MERDTSGIGWRLQHFLLVLAGMAQKWHNRTQAEKKTQSSSLDSLTNHSSLRKVHDTKKERFSRDKIT